MTSLPQEQVIAQTRAGTGLLRGLLPKRWYAHGILWAACILMGLPVLYALLVATQDNGQVFAYQFTPGSSFSQNWDIVWNVRELGRYMLNSTLIAIGITLGKTITALLAGLAFVYFRFPGKWLVFGFVLITLMMPTEIMAIALFRFVSSMNWGNTYIALIIPFTASATGAFLFRQHFSSIPPELSEAAQLDGATPLGFLFRVLIPMSWNTVAALAVIQFLYAWNQYLWPRMIIQDVDHQVIQVGLRSLVAGVETGNSFGPLMLGAVLASVPPVVVFLLLQKQFMGGFSLTRDK